MMDKTREFFENHVNGVMILILACIMTIGTSVYLIVPRVKSITNYNQIIESLGGEDALKSQKRSKTDDVFSQSESEVPETTSYTDTDEYKKTQKEINFKASRYAALGTDNELVLSADRRISEFFGFYTEYLLSPKPDNLEKLKPYTTESYFEKVQKNPDSLDGKAFMVNYIMFSDLDKETVVAYVEMRETTMSCFVDIIEDATKGWIVDKVTFI